MPKFNLNWMYMIIALMLLGLYFANGSSSISKNISYDEFQQYVRDGYVSKVIGYDDNSVEIYIKPQYVGTVFKQDSTRVGRNPMITTEAPSRENLDNFLQKEKEETHFDGSVSYDKKKDYFSAILWNVLPIVFLIALWIFFMRRMGSGASGGAGGVFNVGKSKAQLFEKGGSIKVTFKDVAGLAEAKQEVEEIVEFLKEPQKYTDLGGKIPKGALLVGPPGTGKTLLAKAVAGEANVPFFSLAGSDFVEMFVGVGASRVRDMFAKAKKTAPCMIFIDEIDAVGRQRGAGMGGGHDEREQTLNQLLVEMDGMSDNSGIVVIAATNRPDVLDPALLRPGRFDRQITVSLPDLNGRKAILAVHARNKKLADDVDLEALARRTPGFSGADLENVLNEAAILTVRENKQIIGLSELDEAIDRVMMGPAKKSRTYDEHTKKLVAYHEAGHAIVGLNLPDGAIVQKITIIPRGSAGGYNLITPRKEKILNSRKELIDTITSYMGGRTAEEVFFDDITTGASNDIQQATRIAKDMVKVYGMSELGPIQYDSGEQSIFLGRDYNSPSNASSQVAYEIDQAVRQIIDECHETARKIILEHKSDLVKIAEALIANETITAEEIQDILNDKLVVRDGKLVKAEEVETITDINEPEVVDVEVKPKRTRKKKVTEEKGDNDKAA